MAIIKRVMVTALFIIPGLTAGCGEQTSLPVATAPVIEATPPPAPAPAPEIVGDFASSESWQVLGGAPGPEGLTEGSYTFPALVGALSRKTLPAKEGDKFAVEYTAKTVAKSKNGKVGAYVVGSMFLDATGKVLWWGNVEPPLTEEGRVGRVEATAPVGTTTVHLYISGMWSAEQPPPDGLVGYTAAKLTAIE
jgi:hypothetical protein